MEKDRSTKIIAVAALLFSVAGLALGFAAFSNTLSIEPVAKVQVAEDKFNVVFSKITTGKETGILEPTATTGGALSRETTTIASNGTSIENLGATFSAPGQSVTYEFYAVNLGEYDAYLNEIIYKTFSTTGVKKSCEAGTNTNGTATTESLMNAACAAMTVSVKVGDDEAVLDSTTLTDEHILAKGEAEKIIVTLSYPAKDASDNDVVLVDGNFTVHFGDIDLKYSSTN